LELRKLESRGYKVHFPELKYSTDNAAMIGYTAYLKYTHSNIENEDWQKRLLEPAFARFDYEKF
jgi:tRNA A37 threonylcarbamoyltransferase TsaD